VNLDGVPPEIKTYLWNCGSYFETATVIAVSTPMRSLLQRLSEFERRSVTQAQMKEMEPWAETPQSAVKGVIEHLEEAWPSVVRSYYSAKLQILRRTDVAERVRELLESKFVLTKLRNYSDRRRAIEPPDNESIAKLKEIDTEIQTLTDPAIDPVVKRPRPRKAKQRFQHDGQGGAANDRGRKSGLK
jgi:hypothetical protein